MRILVAAAPETGSIQCDHGTASAHDRAIAALFSRFSQDPARRDAPFAPKVRLRLDTVAQRDVESEMLHDPQAWRFTKAYAGRSGPFSALDLLASSRGDYRLSRGPHPTCTGPEVAPRGPARELRQLSIQPMPTDSCLDWWSVDLFLTDVGQISTVTLTIWEP